MLTHADQGIANLAFTEAARAAGSRAAERGRGKRPRKEERASVKFGIVSDVHCNAAGLERAIALMGEIDELICLGDSI